MRIRERRSGGVAVVDLSGKLTLTDGPGRVKDAVTSLVFQGHRQIVLNLADVSYIDSSGLGELVACYLTAQRFGGTIKLANAGPRIQEALVVTKLNTLFESHRSEGAALAGFAGAPVSQPSSLHPQSRKVTVGTGATMNFEL